MPMGLTFKRKILNCIVGLLKVFLHPPPPLEREGFVKVVHLAFSTTQNESFVNAKMSL
jgi:hypothetical protein